MTASVGRRRRTAAVAFAVVTALLVAAAAVTWYARSALADTEEFTARATAALDDSDLRAVLADRVVGSLTPSVVPDALAVRPLIVPVVAELADTTAFRRVFARVIAGRHRALVDGERSFAISLPLGEGPVYEALRGVAPRVAEGIPPGLRVPVLTLDPFTFELEGARALDDFAGLRSPLLIAGPPGGGCVRAAGGRCAQRAHPPGGRGGGGGTARRGRRGRARRVRGLARGACRGPDRRARTWCRPRAVARLLRRPGRRRAGGRARRLDRCRGVREPPARARPDPRAKLGRRGGEVTTPGGADRARARADRGGRRARAGARAGGPDRARGGGRGDRLPGGRAIRTERRARGGARRRARRHAR